MENIPEKDLYLIDERMKITEERVYHETGQPVMINGKEHIVGIGWQIILRLYRFNIKFSQISYFLSPNYLSQEQWQSEAGESELAGLHTPYIKTLCKSVSKPLNLFLEKLESNVALQA